MRYNNVSLNVLINGRPITEYPHNGQTFVEGRAGSTFAIEVVNHNPWKVEAVVSVDGLSVIDGKEAGPASTGYLLEAGERLSIPGWKLSDSQVAAFEFAGKDGSYAGQTGSGSTRNTGVIGLLVYREKVVEPVRRYYPLAMGGIRTRGLTSCAAGAVPLGFSTSDNGWNLYQQSFAADALSVTSMSADSALGGSRGIAKGPKGPTGGAAPEALVGSEALSVEQVLGTAFGQAQDFATTSVAFTRGDLLGLLALYYDDARALRARGIVMDRRSKVAATQTPNPFPGASCTPPAGWRG